MDNNTIKDTLVATLKLKEAHVSNNGSHFQVIAIGDVFSGLSRVKKQQIVYQVLITYITDSRIHSVSIRTYTPEEWIR
ncbi:Acid stress protein IbaG [Candidatus Erwinia haradaeae]|uniref:Acid stress protein IbaG n=1 Tax=Candidatus Erwinia haradaeae TaxID=1922217 RepID=A0A451D7R4_9GAMM|nr:BolA family protein [Candidatus Erwinia haradaeae]VFP81889.1 Acid stress protein IbaG [Candidatus Erwinia haradaeae]